jgi:hypothetical protein
VHAGELSGAGVDAALQRRECLHARRVVQTRLKLRQAPHLRVSAHHVLLPRERLYARRVVQARLKLGQALHLRKLAYLFLQPALRDGFRTMAARRRGGRWPPGAAAGEGRCEVGGPGACPRDSLRCEKPFFMRFGLRSIVRLGADPVKGASDADTGLHQRGVEVAAVD